ncbi:hypothetical protein LSAT2_018425 [Lamellibrachia satsuma]|nr:hypothetical protein LSAT2_018425 [Lamellibrachia satsuma]
MMVSLKNPHVAAVIVFNVIFIVLGAAVVCGAIALAKKVFQNYVKMRLQNLSINTDSVDFSELDSFVNTLMALGLATGGILFLMGTIGVVGASYCNNICLNLCAAFLIASALMCTVPPIGMYTNYVDDQIYRQVLEKMGNSYTGHNNKHMWSAIMNAFMMSVRLS